MGIANFYGLVVPYNTISHLRSQYRIDNDEAEATCVITNKTPNAPAWGAGRVTAAFVIERVLERVARPRPGRSSLEQIGSRGGDGQSLNPPTEIRCDFGVHRVGAIPRTVFCTKPSSTGFVTAIGTTRDGSG